MTRRLVTVLLLVFGLAANSFAQPQPRVVPAERFVLTTGPCTTSSDAADPEGVKVGKVCDEYKNVTTGTHWVKASGTWNTGWKQVSVGSFSTILQNYFFGENAGNSTATGEKNVAVGSSSLRNVTTGAYNNAFGEASLYATTTGSYNSAFGAGAVRSATSASDNTAFGFFALRDTTTGFQNSAFGSDSMQANTTGQLNAAFGQETMLVNTTGTYNTALGAISLNSNTEGSFNTAVGMYALGLNTTANANTAVGYNAGTYLNDGTSPNATSSQSVYVGSQSTALASGDVNELVLGNGATGYGSNTAVLGNSGITKTILRGKVGIGTTDPQETFQVSGGNVTVVNSSNPTIRIANLDTTHADRKELLLTYDTTGNYATINAIDEGAGSTPLVLQNVGGNVGVGMTPARLLDVAGTFGATGAASFSDTVGYPSYTSGWTGSGWRFDQGVSYTGQSFLELDRLSVRGIMSVYELLVHQIRATNGSIFVANTGKAKTVTANGGGSYTILTETDHGFSADDLIRAQRFTGTGTWVSDLTVTGVADTTHFTATLRSGGYTVPAAGMEFVRLGNTSDAGRQGSIYMTADDLYAPYIDILSGVASFADWGTSAKIRGRLGNLHGWGGYTTDTFGTGFGDTAAANLVIDATNGIRFRSGTTPRITMDSTDGLRFFKSDGTTVALSLDMSGSAAFTGSVTAAIGYVGGWTIGATSLSDTAGMAGISSAVTGADDIRFWAGHATPASAPFYVTEAGALHATNATISGNITANSGTFGYGRNQLQTTEFAKGVGDSIGDGLGWRVGSGTDAETWTLMWNHASWPLALYLQAVGTPANGTFRSLDGPAVPVTASTVYEFSAYLGLYRATYARLYISWRNAADAEIGSDVVGTACTTASTGGLTLAQYCRTGGVVTSPALAVTAFLTAFVACDGSTNPVLFMRRPMFAEGHAGQTAISEWGPGGVTLITPDGIQTPNLSALSADLGTATAGSIVIGTTNKLWLNDAADGGLAIGGSTKASAPIRMSAAGAFFANNATITGNITGTSGSFTGAVYASSGSFTGAVMATSGAIGGCSLDSTTLTCGTTTLSSSGIYAPTLSLISANLGTVTAGSVSGITLSGSTVYAGSGSNEVTLDSDGITFKEGAGTANKMKWGSGGYIYGFNAHMNVVGDWIILNGTTAGTLVENRLQVNGNADPYADNTNDMGQSGYYWRRLHVNEITSSAWAGGGTRFVCVGNDGVLFPSATACDLNPQPEAVPATVPNAEAQSMEKK